MNGDAFGRTEPYIGPRPFEARDRHLFFGRERETHEISSLVLANRFFVLSAASGTGKTSLVNAGVLPLVKDELEVLPSARFQTGVPRGPADVRNVYTHAVLSEWEKQRDMSTLVRTTLTEYLDGRRRVPHSIGIPMPRLLVFDQFEELFTTHPDRWPERREFLEQLAEASQSDPDLRVLIVLREDFLSRLLSFASIFYGGLKSRYFLEPLRRPAAELAITRPMRMTGRKFESGAVADLVRRLMTSRVDLGGLGTVRVEGEFVEPVLLQVVCQALWSALPASVSAITLTDVRELADVDTSLTRFYSDTVRKAADRGPVSEYEIRTWVQENLLTAGGTRAVVYVGAETTEGLPNEVVSSLEGTLLRAEFRAGARWLEITHDSLLEPIERSNREFFRDRFRATDTAATTEADRLAVAVKEQWIRAAAERGLLQPEPIPVRWGRPSQPVSGPAAVATSSRLFAPLPGLGAVRERTLQAGQLQDLLAVYGGLGSGRLLIVGPPGSGKSAAGVLLVLTALGHREQVPEKDRALVPVPVLFSLHGWDPQTQRIEDWLITQLRQTYPFLADKKGAVTARELLAAGRLAVILDGLDEIAAPLRPVCLRALSQRAVFRIVILARTAEMAAAAASRGTLEGAVAVELQAIDASTAADYLERGQHYPPPQGWRELIHHLRSAPNGSLAKALSSPLALTLVRDSYSRDSVADLLHFSDRTGPDGSPGQIVDHLFDRVLPTAYAHRPGEPPSRYELPVARRTLSVIAAQMNQDGTRDLAWWQVPAWLPRVPRSIATGLVAALATGLVAVLGAWLGAMRGSGFGAGFVFVIGIALVGLVTMLKLRTGALGLRAPRRWQWRKWFTGSSLMVGLAGGLVVGLVWGLISGFTKGLAFGLDDGLLGGLVGWLALGGLYGLSRPGAGNASAMSPLASWRQERAFGVAVGLWSGLVGGILLGRLEGLTVGLAGGLVAAVVTALLFPDTWAASLAFVQLARRFRTPVGLMRFLEDARERNVLRSVGPLYQFRHARLQDRLAGSTQSMLTIDIPIDRLER